VLSVPDQIVRYLRAYSRRYGRRLERAYGNLYSVAWRRRNVIRRREYEREYKRLWRLRHGRN
jgi:hypothetical protein